MGHLLGAVTQAKLDEQRGVVQNEKRQGENEPYGRVWDFLTPRVYPANHPYSWTAIGSMEDLDAAKLEDVKEWFRTYYGAANAVVVVAGDIDPADVKARVEKYFGDIPAGPADHPAGAVGRQAHRKPARRHAGPGAPGADLQGVERARLGHGGRRVARPGRRPALDRQVVPALQAAGLRRADRHRRQRLRRPARDRRALRHRGDRPARCRSGQGRAGGRRGAGAVPRRRPDARGAAAGEDRLPRRLRPRRSSGSVGSAASRTCWPRRGLRRPARLLQDAAPAGGGRHAGAGPRDGEPLADRRRLHPRGAPLRRAPGGRAGVDRSKLPETGDAARRQVSPVRARHAVQRARRSCSRGATAIPQVRFDLLLDAGYAADQFGIPGTAEPGDGDAGRGHQDPQLDRHQRRARRRSAPTSAPARGSTCRRVSLEALKDKLDASLAVYADVDAQPLLPRGRLRAAQAAAARPDPAGEGGPGRHGAAGLPGTALRAGPRLRQSLDRLRHRGVHQPDHPRRSGEVPPHLVQAQQRDADRRRRHHHGRDQAQAGAGLRGWTRARCRSRTSRTVEQQPRSTVYLLDRPEAHPVADPGRQRRAAEGEPRRARHRDDEPGARRLLHSPGST